jgi:hypothetical protein
MKKRPWSTAMKQARVTFRRMLTSVIVAASLYHQKRR